jgi:hypothetical protein
MSPFQSVGGEPGQESICVVSYPSAPAGLQGLSILLLVLWGSGTIELTVTSAQHSIVEGKATLVRAPAHRVARRRSHC